MKKDMILEKSNLSYWLRQLRKEMLLIGPMHGENGDIVLKTVENIHEIVLDCPALIPSPKEFLFPQKEEMFGFSTEGTKNYRNSKRRLIFGVRSCDVSAIGLLDRFYGGKFIDDYYTARRENTVFISVGCNKPDPTCFCNGLGTGPFLSSGFDIQFSDLGDRYLVEIGSEHGLSIVKKFSHLFSKPQKSDYDDQYEAILSSHAMFEKRINLENARQKILSGSVEDSFWAGVAERCFECGGCVYECPLCTCFNVIDRKYSAIEGVRLRNWDTCMFRGFTKMAVNVWPAEKKIMRTKRWYFHKLLYYPEQFGRFGCVGCGRCTITCPGRIDMATIAYRLKVGNNED
ncbi:MAG: 4Fe-4S dicluster domain-containing protein [Nitrospirae bacterium]|nr:4Fe-4S dicluster domain-containing protein [Nitrospirota bacterium]